MRAGTAISVGLFIASVALVALSGWLPLSELLLTAALAGIFVFGIGPAVQHELTHRLAVDMLLQGLARRDEDPDTADRFIRKAAQVLQASGPLQQLAQARDPAEVPESLLMQVRSQVDGLLERAKRVARRRMWICGGLAAVVVAVWWAATTA